MQTKLKSILITVAVLLYFFAVINAQGKLPESSIKTVYITPFSHYDFGFVEPPNAVRERAARHIDEVLRAAKEDPNFRWTIESTWQVDEWLKRQRKPESVLPKDKKKINELMDLIKSGRIALSTSWGSMHTDFMGQEELNRLVYPFAKLERTYGIHSQLAMMNDVPGHPTSIPNVLAGSGTKYLVTGANLFINQATSLAPGKVPFYWESPDGSKVLTWISQGQRGGYVEALTDFYLDPFSLDPYTDKTPFDMFNPEQAGKKTPIEIMEIGVTELLNRYNKAGYNFDAVMALYAHDFIEPSHVFNLEKAVKLWNDKHAEVKLKIATPNEFLSYIEGKYGNRLETHRGEWSGLWSEAKTQSPKISALARYTHDHAPAAEALWSALAMERALPYPVGNFSQIYDLVMTYDEHSGAGNNGWMQLNSSEPLFEQNREYVGFMTRSRKEVDMMLKNGINVLAQPNRFDEPKPQRENQRTVVVYNGLSFSRNDVVHIKSPNKNLEIVSVKDAALDSEVPFEATKNGGALLIAKDVPSDGYRTYLVSTKKSLNKSKSVSDKAGRTIENERFRVTANTAGNIESILDKTRNREIVNQNGEMPFNALLRIEGSDPSKVQYPLPPKFTVHNGVVMSELRIERRRSVFPVTTVRIYKGLDRVEVRNELDSNLPFVGGNNNWHDSYYFAFPLNIKKETLKIKRDGQKWFDTLPDDYLPGARRDSVTTQHLLAITDGANSALIAHRQAFHWVYSSFVDTKVLPKDAPKGFPAMFTGKFPLPEATVYSRAVRKSSQSDTHDLGVINMKTVEPGLKGNYVFDYAFTAEGKFDIVEARRMGSEFNQPLLAQFVADAPAQLARSFFSVDKSNVEIVTVKSLSDSVIRGEVSAAPLAPEIKKVFVFRLQEFAGRTSFVTVKLPVKIKNAEIVDLDETKSLGNIETLSPLVVKLNPFETKTVKFEIE
ncbi:MAG: glycosyl hydrolase-related protein [Pyrinomonadaceae bacterium]